VVGGDAVKNEVKAARVPGHLLGVLRDDDLICSKTKSVVLLVRRSRKEHYLGSEGVGELHPHVTEASKPNDADSLALSHSPVMEGREGRDASTQKRCDACEVEIRWDFEYEALVDDDAVRVAAIGNATGAFVGEVVGLRSP
jgi:hypothetical protein